jgi:hypothetical protein
VSVTLFAGNRFLTISDSCAASRKDMRDNTVSL